MTQSFWHGVRVGFAQGCKAGAIVGLVAVVLGFYPLWTLGVFAAIGFAADVTLDVCR